MKKLTALFLTAAVFCGLMLCVSDNSAKADTSEFLNVIEILEEKQPEFIDPESGKLLYRPMMENTSELVETQPGYVK